MGRPPEDLAEYLGTEETEASWTGGWYEDTSGGTYNKGQRTLGMW